MKTKILKIATLILAIVLIFSACGKVSSTNSNETNNDSTTISDNKTEPKADESETNSSQANSNETTKGEKTTSQKDAESTTKNSLTTKDVSKIKTTTPTTGLRVKGTRLVDKNGNNVQLRGVSTHGIAWYPQYVNKECFKNLRDDMGVNTIRLAMYTAEYGGYCSGGNKDELKSLVKKGVQYATELNMYVIIDWHILSDGNPKTYEKEAKAFFREMSSLYKNYNNVLYEICNEPNGGTDWKTIKSYAENIIPIIRENSPNSVIIVGTPTWSQDVDIAAQNPIKKYDNIMYALHFYAGTHKDDLRSKAKSALNKGLPIFVSEFGICDASGNGALDTASANEWIKFLNSYLVSYVNWNLSNKNESSSLIKSSCNKTSGFTEKDLSQSGLWVLKTYKGTTTINSTPTTTKKAEETTKTTTQALEKGSANIKYTAKVTNSWEQDGKTYYQYELTIKNTGSASCSKWSVNINFNEDFTLSDKWCGKYTKSGKALKITNESYNGSISPNGTVTNVGFIVAGSKNLKIT